ncbi:Fic family protein [Demequina sp. TTPB684]|uniref:Fic family protein n=1 Tax=unclassified Demequina TaxID=2620311 RepID=UPI001CF2C343|nr:MULTISPECIES: Fic family protein [unclassified Demequina]MCB2413943.1 Fic family protein [Demequina sp. TTPB684]UPU88703.1 Fic family protein [Demequina sp. TMPB413]
MTSGVWPALAWEEHTWRPATRWGVRANEPRAEMRYEAAVPPFIADRTPELSAATAGEARMAEQELSRLDAELGSRMSAFAPVLLRSEAASSSQIENLTASARAIFSAELGVKTGRNAEQITANTRSLQAAIALADEPSARSILEMHRVLMEGQIQHSPGTWRKEAVWIGTSAQSPVGAEFVAPHHSRVPALVDDLVAFCARDGMSPLVAMAIGHAQFEAIHPFTDGNGRTGRALAQAMLRRTAVTRNVALPVSAGLLADVEGYHGALTAYRDGDVEPIVLAFAHAISRAIRNTRTLVAELDEVRAAWESALQVRRNSHAWRLLDVLIRRPVLSAALAAQELGVKQPNVYPPLRALTEAGIVKSKNEHRLGPFWRADDVLAAVDRFAERAGRREAS